MNIAITRVRKFWATVVSLGFVLLAPALAFAQSNGINQGEIQTYTQSIIDFFNDVLIPLILAVAFLVFIWGVFRFFIMGAQDETARENGKSLMIWGIIGFVVIISIVGIVALLGNATGLTGENLDNDVFDIDIPGAGSSGGGSGGTIAI